MRYSFYLALLRIRLRSPYAYTYIRPRDSPLINCLACWPLPLTVLAACLAASPFFWTCFILRRATGATFAFYQHYLRAVAARMLGGGHERATARLFFLRAFPRKRFNSVPFNNACLTPSRQQLYVRGCLVAAATDKRGRRVAALRLRDVYWPTTVSVNVTCAVGVVTPSYAYMALLRARRRLPAYVFWATAIGSRRTVWRRTNSDVSNRFCGGCSYRVPPLRGAFS